MGELNDRTEGGFNNAVGDTEQGPSNTDQHAQGSPARAEASVASSSLDAVPASSAVAPSTLDAPSEGIPSPCDNTAPGSHVEAACHGPTADNPSLSIQKRLKRARFFDQRELLVAAGEAAPMETDAGLPDAVEVPEVPQG